MIQSNAFQQYFFQSGQDLIKILRERPYIAPVYLVKIRLLGDSVSLYFSTHTVNVAGITWENYIIDITSLDDEIKRVTSDIYNTNVKVTLRNDPYGSSSYLIQRGDTYSWLGAECTIYEAYREGDTFSGLSCINKYIIDEVSEIDTSKFTLNLCSKVTNIDDTWKEKVVNLVDYPNAYDDVGKTIPFIYSSYGIMIPTLRVDWGAKTTLVNSIDSTQVTGIYLSESERFPSSGTLQIDDEKISYTGISAYQLTGVTRHEGGTTATVHNNGATIWESKSYYDSIVANHPCDVSEIYADIQGKTYRVTSGATSIEIGGKQYIRMVPQISITETANSSVTDTISFSSTETMKICYPTSATGSWSNPSNAIDGNYVTYAGCNTIDTYFHVDFSSTSYGTITGGQYFYIVYGANDDGYATMTAQHTLPSTGGTANKQTVRIYDSSTNWAMNVQFKIKTAGQDVYVYEVWKEVAYLPQLTKSGTVTITNGIVNSQKVDRIIVKATGAKGSNGLLAARPDRVIYDFLSTKLSIPDSEIDVDSFSNAGNFYDGTYYIDTYQESITPSKFLAEIAKESRSTLKYIRGKWTLTVLPSSAPTSIATIDSTMVSGEYGRFVFGSSPKKDIKNSITASYKKAYVKMETESDWIKTVSTSDATSISKYGTYSENIEFNHIRNDTCATDLIAFKLLQQKYPLLTLQFDVFWEYVNLLVGDTITITNGLYNNTQFYIEKIDRTQQGIKISAIQWY